MTVFHKKEPPWFDQVRDLKPGARRRISDSELVSYNGKGYGLYNFREKQHEVYEPTRSLAEKLEILKQMREQTSTAQMSSYLPSDCMFNPRDWPSAARVWLYEGGFNDSEVEDVLHACWAARMGRVMIPFRKLLEPDHEAWVARRITGISAEGPKYLFPFGVNRGGGAVTFKADMGPFEPEQYVITEDVLSSTRITLTGVGAQGIAANGTTLDRGALLWLAKKKQPVAVWLDPDKYGKLGAAAITSSLTSLGKDVHIIRSEMDPKKHDDQYIRDRLKET